MPATSGQRAAVARIVSGGASVSATFLLIAAMAASHEEPAALVTEDAVLETDPAPDAETVAGSDLPAPVVPGSGDPGSATAGTAAPGTVIVRRPVLVVRGPDGGTIPYTGPGTAGAPGGPTTLVRPAVPAPTATGARPSPTTVARPAPTAAPTTAKPPPPKPKPKAPPTTRSKAS